MQEILLDDARMGLERSLASSVGLHPLDDVFAYWLVPGCVAYEHVAASIAKAAAASGAHCTYQEVAILGFATQIADLSDEDISALRNGLEILSGREPIVGGTPMGFVIDGVALLGIAIGVIGAKSNVAMKEKVAAWIQRCRVASSATSVPDWQRTLIDAAFSQCHPGSLVEMATDPECADVRVMLRAKGVLKGHSDEAAEADELQIVTTLRNACSDWPMRNRAAVWLCGLNYIRSKTSTIALNRLSVRDVGDILRKLEAALRKWTWEDKPRTTRRAGEARKWHVENEYHVQNLLWVVLAPLFPDLTEEVYTPKIGTLQPRADICIPSLRLIVEVKFWRAEVSSQEMIRQIAQDNSLYPVPGSRYDMIIAVIWDNAGRTEQHDVLRQGFLQLQNVVDAVVVSRPSMMGIAPKNAESVANAVRDSGGIEDKDGK